MKVEGWRGRATELISTQKTLAFPRANIRSQQGRNSVLRISGDILKIDETVLVISLPLCVLDSDGASSTCKGHAKHSAEVECSSESSSSLDLVHCCALVPHFIHPPTHPFIRPLSREVRVQQDISDTKETR